MSIPLRGNKTPKMNYKKKILFAIKFGQHEIILNANMRTFLL